MQRVYGLVSKRLRVLRHYQQIRERSDMGGVASRVVETFCPSEEEIPRASWATSSLKLKPRQDFAHRPSTELEEQEDISRSSEMTDEEIDKWLESYEIPAEALEHCETHQEVRKVRQMYAKQLRLECSVHDIAMERYKSTREQIATSLGKGANLKSSKTLLDEWFRPLCDALRAEQLAFLKNTPETYESDRHKYGPALLLFKPETIAVVLINEVLNLALSNKDGAAYVKVTTTVADALQYELKYIKNQKDAQKVWVRIARLMTDHRMQERTKSLFETPGHWDKRMTLKLGGILVEYVLKHCKIRNPDFDPTDLSIPEFIPAFEHAYWQVDKKRRIGVLRCAEPVYSYIVDGKQSFLPWTARFLPMLVKPKPWTSPRSGGYLKLETSIMRQRDNQVQEKFLREGELGPLCEALNVMSSVPWQINTRVYQVVKKLWAEGGNFGDLPPRTDLEIPDEKNFDVSTPEGEETFKRLVRKIQRQNRERHSLRCDTVYKLQVAEEFAQEDEMYFPFNVDFRGRVYPIPPHLNHLGSDLSRSLLIFKEPKRLGENGLRWLKIHLANLYGVNKCSFDDRVAFVDQHLDQIIDSARQPLDGNRWWADAEYPFLALGVCFDIERAYQCENPQDYESCLPIHQDGSCNGLQHYAALGQDSEGAFHVNLTPTDKPQDVYTGVADRVVEQMRQDATMEFGAEIEKPEFPIEMQRMAQQLETLETTEAFNEAVEEYRRQVAVYKRYQSRVMKKKHANLVLNYINRKVVKQTVMTSVYGVTFIGARKQINARLEEQMLENSSELGPDWETDVYNGSCYAARVTMESMGGLFHAAKNIMDWLSACASIVASQGQPMAWVTPLGIPVVQPYRRQGSIQIKTRVQHVVVSLTENLPVSAQRQRTAFPPNYVHSLDSTHMLMTALGCKEAGVTFAAVHDSFWTHAGSVETMNSCLRQEFVNLYHNNQLLEELRDQLQIRFPSCDFPPVPEKKDFDVTQVLDSPYFFN